MSTKVWKKNTTKIIKTAFDVAVSTFNNGSQMTSKCSKKKKKLKLYDSFKKIPTFLITKNSFIPSSTSLGLLYHNRQCFHEVCEQVVLKFNFYTKDSI